jgi:trimeric autotransporter adhesin
MLAFPRVLSFAAPLSTSTTVRRALRPVLSTGFALLLMVGILAPGAAVQAQVRRPGLITQAVNEANRVVLSGNTHPLATRAADRGAVPDSTPANRMLLLFKRSPEQESQLRVFLESLQDANSPNFHKWLTPEQFGAQWGPADSDVAAVTAWLQARGFSVAGMSPGRVSIEFSGTAGQLKQAFQTEIHTYVVGGETHHANNANPTIPAALAPVVAGITTLNDFHGKSPIKPGPLGIYNTTTHQAHKALTASDSTENFLYVGPADAATIYDTPIPALNSNYSGRTIDGTGATIGVAGEANINLSQNANYRKFFGLAASTPTVIIDGGTDPGITSDSVEFYLDTEVSNGIAPGAKLYFYTSAGTDVEYGINLAVLRAVDDNVVDVLNLSWEECEAYLGAAGNAFVEAVWEQAAAQGISVSVASSDSGSAGCDDFDTETVAISGLQVNGWSSTPYNISVGGTDFEGLAGPDGNGADFTNYVSLSNTPGTLRSAYGYIPESPWNDSVTTFPLGALATNQGPPSNNPNIVAGSGGRSNCTTGSVQANGTPVCSGGYAKPSWQVAPGVPADKVRDIPDVSLLAGNGYDFAAWAICTDQDYDPNGNLLTVCTLGADGLSSDEFYIQGVGGTSAASPAFAGVLALIKSATGERQGQADHVLYNLARTNPAVFHDITTGNNSVPCMEGTPSCAKNTAGYYYETGYNAGVGYDLASGLGSVDAAALISNWSSAGLAATITTLTATPTSIVHGTPVTVTASVTGSGSVPKGDVSLIANVNAKTEPNNGAVGVFTLNSSGTIGTQEVNYLPGGSYSLFAHYGGSEIFAQSTSAGIPFKVTPESSNTVVTLTGFSPSTGQGSSGTPQPYGFYLAIDAQPYGQKSAVVDNRILSDGTATGTVAFTLNSGSLGTAAINAEGYAEIEPQLSPGNYALKAVYSGDASFDPSTTPYNFTISKAPTQLILKASSTKYTGTPIVFTVALSTLSIGAAPTGTVALKSGSTILAEGNLVGTAPTSTALAAGTVTISTANLPFGTTDITAEYLGDANYAESISNGIEIQGKPTFVLSSTPIILLGEHTTGGGYIATTSEGGYAGTVNYTCELTTKVTTSTPPECGMYPSSETLAAGKTAEPMLLIFGKGTKLPVGVTAGSNSKWPGIGLGTGGAVLACCLLLGVPARRRGWRSMLSALLLLAALAGFTACVATPKFITNGVYTFNVTGTDSKDSTLTSTTTVQVTVH